MHKVFNEHFKNKSSAIKKKKERKAVVTKKKKSEITSILLPLN